jgi:hypothetical protein
MYLQLLVRTLFSDMKSEVRALIDYRQNEIVKVSDFWAEKFRTFFCSKFWPRFYPKVEANHVSHNSGQSFLCLRVVFRTGLY